MSDLNSHIKEHLTDYPGKHLIEYHMTSLPDKDTSALLDEKVSVLLPKDTSELLDKKISDLLDEKASEFPDEKEPELLDTSLGDLLDKRVAELLDGKSKGLSDKKLSDFLYNKEKTLLKGRKVSECLGRTQDAQLLKKKVSELLSPDVLKLLDKKVSELMYKDVPALLDEDASNMKASSASLLRSGEPVILTSRAIFPNQKYKCFGILRLYSDLFEESESANPLIDIDNGLNKISKETHSKIVEFLLPLDSFIKERQHTTHSRKTKQDGHVTGEISDAAEIWIDFADNPHKIITDVNNSNNDYKGFLTGSIYNVKITNFLHDVFTINWREFITKMQQHIISGLRSANLSNNKALIEYLRQVGNETIVPESINSNANRVFISLLTVGDHASLSKIIANFFISVCLGLRSKYYNGKRQADTYFLNGYGMELIWMPESITTSYEEVQKIKPLYSVGEYKEAVKQTKAWLSEEKEDENNVSAFALAWEMLGDCLYLHTTACDPNAKDNKGLYNDMRAEGVEYWKKCEKTGYASSDVYFHLYEAYRDKDRPSHKDYLQIAFDKNNAQAVIECAELNTKLNKYTKDQLYEKLNYIITRRANYEKTEVSKCFYRLAIMCQEDEKTEDADKYMAEAARCGHDEARQQISRKARAERQTPPRFTNSPDRFCCFVNSLTGNNLAFISSMPSGTWSLYTSANAPLSGINAEFACDIDTFIASQKIGCDDFLRPYIVFLFMSEDKQKNLNECLRLLDKLFNIALSASENNRNRMIDSIDIYVGAEYETASMMIDASINDMGKNIYFKVHIADETRDCVHRLLCDAPLFTPLLNKGENASNVVLFGCSETNYRFIKESIASSYLGERCLVTVTMLGSDSERLECKLRQECPGLYPEPQTKCIKPQFIPCNIAETDFPSLIYGKTHGEKPDDPLIQALSCGNYFVVDFADDYTNIKFAMALRTWLLRSRGTFERAPFIAVKCKDRQNSYLAEHLTLSGQPAGESYYSKYDLFPFGIAGEIYSYHSLIENPRLEQTALNIHKSYYGGNERQAENDYYSFSYNADSSLLMAIGLSCRMFAAGAYFARREDYRDFKAFDSEELIDKYSKYCETSNNKEDLAELEQSRWNGFMLSRGWECASNAQIQAYGKQSTGSSHKHTLAKLHPFIREWADLEDSKLQKTLGILQKDFKYNKKPRDITRQNVEDAPKFLEKPKTLGGGLKMTKLSCKTQNNLNAQEKAHVYFACHPDDFNTYFEPIYADLFAGRDCAVFYDSEPDIPWDEAAMDLELAEMKLIVIPVTSKFLYEPNEAKDTVFHYAVKKHIPILPLMQWDSLSNQPANMPDTIKSRIGKVASFTNFGDICKAERFLKEARKWYKGAARIAQKLADETDAVETRRNLSLIYNKLGNTYRGYAAQKWYIKGLEIREKLVRETESPEAYDDLAVSYCYLEEVSLTRDGILRFKEAESIWENLVNRCPDEPRYADNLKLVRERIAKAEKKSKKHSDFLSGQN